MSYPKRYSDEQLLASLLQDARKLGRTPKLQELSYRATLVKRFGSYSEALEKVGLKPTRVFYNDLSGKRFTELVAIRQKGVNNVQSPFLKQMKLKK